MGIEMKQLDGDRKTLVYENYTKLIDASDTIRSMRENIESIETEMSKLSQQVQDITSLASDLHWTFTNKKKQVHQLKNTASLLRRLHFLFALPKRLAQSMNDGTYLKATQFYSTTKTTLARYSHVPLFSKISSDCQQSVTLIRSTMKSKLRKKEYSYMALLEYIKVLVAIGQDDSTICDQFVEGCVSITNRVVPLRSNVVFPFWITLISLFVLEPCC
jgi:uncharacterized protein (UPF0335 family)